MKTKIFRMLKAIYFLPALAVLSSCSPQSTDGAPFRIEADSESTPAAPPWTKTEKLGQDDQARENAQDAESEAERLAASAALQKKASQNKTTPALTPKTAVEVIWKAPEESVLRYHLHWGLTRGQLDRKRRIPMSAIEQTNDPKHGLIYKYILRNVPQGKRIFISLIAENKFGISETGQVFEVVP